MLTQNQTKDFDTLVAKLQEEGFSPASDLRDPKTPWAVAAWVGEQKVCEEVKDAVAHTFAHHEAVASARMNAWEAAALITEVKRKLTTA